MDGNGCPDGQDDIDGGIFNDKFQLRPSADDEEKKLFWLEGVMGCFSSVISVFRPPAEKPALEEKWEIPAEAITNLVYLGSGAQGVVYGGQINNEMVAVKKLRDPAETDIKHLRKLNHDNIVRFRGVVTKPPTYCVVMEYCQYGPLFEFLHSGSLFAPKQILKWAKEIANGMAYLHSHKIIHRDLKSPNILIADNLVVKVSDFGTSREWNDVSAIMSFTGTVAWMAPEVIRHEPCSERVDVWSFGVVLWELLTQEASAWNMETHAIMWGVGTDTISLPVPATVPDSMQLLLTQFWNRTPKNRPPFKIIAAHLEIAGDEFAEIHQETFSVTQQTWKREVQEGMAQLYTKSEKPADVQETATRKEELKHARDIRLVYEKQLARANELYMEACAVKLQLEQREAALTEREKALKACRCFRKVALHRQSSTSSDGKCRAEPGHRRPRKRDTVITQQQQQQKTSTALLSDGNKFSSIVDGVKNNNLEKETADTVVEKNGNVELKDVVNDNYIDEVVAQV
ncbi:mitogen-activated protein kinase kinase kinase 12-like [Cydia amplana]|uniref:mitogen-activated protein kinase kinase kinase 12-like n=1 Tax=Cydia amplana TaxID=1869771 RepID=UPI002FE5CA23